MRFPTPIISILVISMIIYSTKTYANNDQLKISAPTEITAQINNPQLIGSATLSILMFDLYDIYLWSNFNRHSYQQPFAININYKKNFSKESLVERSLKEMQKNNIITQKQESYYQYELNRVFRDIKKGDSKTAIYFPNQKLSLYHNHKFVGDIKNDRLARLFVDIWLDERSSFPELTAKLLGKIE